MNTGQDRRERRRHAQESFDAMLEQMPELIEQPGVDRATMFGSKGVRVRGRFLAFVGADGELVVKLPAARVTELVAAGTGSRVRIGRNPAKEWIGIPAPDLAPDSPHQHLWRSLLLEAHRHAGH